MIKRRKLGERAFEVEWLTEQGSAAKLVVKEFRQRYHNSLRLFSDDTQRELLAAVVMGWIVTQDNQQQPIERYTKILFAARELLCLS